jgi:hypothetical protein
VFTAHIDRVLDGNGKTLRAQIEEVRRRADAESERTDEAITCS